MTNNIVQGLLMPDAYPWNPATVDVIETHISWVFLAGDYVIKVKRPVDLGFVDFTDLERRHHFCQEEVRLNNRLTTDVYLSALPIVSAAEGLRVDGDGKPVEWCTLMRRLPANRMLDALLSTGSAPEDLAATLAERLLPFHQEVTVDCPFAESDYLGVVSENLTQLESFAGSPLAPFQLELVSGALRQFVEQAPSRFRSRVPKWTREGHGDLRTEHICLERDGRVQIFDCVEFSQEIRCADVASDLAFLLMDLRRVGADDTASEILERYRAAGFDLPDDLVRFYIAHRALVRTKVACLERSGVSEETRQRLAIEAADYLNLATASALNVPPMLIAVSGLSGSGKSTVAKAVARALGTTVHSADVVRKELAGLEPTQSAATAWHGGIYSPEWSRRTYDELLSRALRDIEQGRPTIIDATLLDNEERVRLAAAASGSHAPLLIIETVCDERVLLHRIRARAEQTGVTSDAGEEIYWRQRQEIERERLVLPPGALFASVDTSSDGPIDLDTVLQRLSAAGLIKLSPAGFGV